MKKSLPFALLALVALALGCGDSGRYRVSGRVTFDGQRVPVGMVTFLPIGPSDVERSAGFCQIKAGQFDSRAGRSPMEGLHRVLISGFDGVAYTSEIAGMVEHNPEGKPLFPLYAVEVEIPKAQGTVLDFDVPKTSSPSR